MDDRTAEIIIVVLAGGLLAWAWWLGQFSAFGFRFVVFCAATLALWWLGAQAFERLPDPWGMLACLAIWTATLPLGWWTMQPIAWGTDDWFDERDAQGFEEEEEPAPAASVAPDPAQVVQANVQALARRRP